MSSTPSVPAVARITVAGTLALTIIEILWEALLAPLPGGRWLAFKAVPLMLLLPGVAQGRRRPRQWLTLLLPFYFAEALVRALTESGRQRWFASLAVLVALATFTAVLLWLRGRDAGPR